MSSNRNIKDSKDLSSYYALKQLKGDSRKRVKKDGNSSKDKVSLEKPNVMSQEYVEIPDLWIPQTNSSQPQQGDHVLKIIVNDSKRDSVNTPEEDGYTHRPIPGYLPLLPLVTRAYLRVFIPYLTR